ncbi:hypothetical protein B296_00050193 [Ensete ventricosum]|uniref:Uncharacterized protein n=1 Tax=Ensete ventricosum TaxID=4639 RepID=A0A426YMD5_ENSVE|nr:hypothetical protein B296_00050193 [Ensete ventricosum]
MSWTGEQADEAEGEEGAVEAHRRQEERSRALRIVRGGGGSVRRGLLAARGSIAPKALQVVHGKLQPRLMIARDNLRSGFPTRPRLPYGQGILAVGVSLTIRLS